MLPSTESQFPQYFDFNGDPLDEGSIYYGQINANPVTSPIPLFWDAEGTQPVSQPVRTLNGFPVRFGTPSNVFVDGAYSISVYDKKGRLIYTEPDSTEYSAKLYNSGAAGAVTRPVNSKLSDIISVKDFGATGDGVTDDTLAIQKTIDYAGSLISGGAVYFPAGNYVVTSTLNVDTRGVALVGASRDSVNIIRTTAFGPLVSFTTGSSAILDGVGISNVRLVDNGLNNSTGTMVEVDNVSRFSATEITMFGGTNGFVLKAASNVDIVEVSMYMQNPSGTPAGRYGIQLAATAIGGAPVAFGSNVNLTNVAVYGGDNFGGGFANLDDCLRIETVDGITITGCYFGGSAIADVHIVRTNPAHTCGNIYMSNNMLDICRGNGLLLDGTEVVQRLLLNNSVSCSGVGGALMDGIRFAGPADNVTITGTSSGWKSNGLNLGGGVVLLNHVTITGMVVTANDAYGITLNASVNSNNIVITGNDLTGNVNGGILDNTAETTVKNLEGNIGFSPPWIDFTPTLGSGGGSITATTSGKYKQIGNMVFVQMEINTVSADTGTGFLTLTLPTKPGVSLDVFALAAQELSANVGCIAHTQSSSGTVILTKYDGMYPSAVGFSFTVSGVYQVA